MIRVPEMENDIDVDDYEYHVSIENESSDNRLFKDIVQQDVIPQLKTKLRSFPTDLVSKHSKDIYINPEEMGQSTPPRAATPISAESPTPKTTVASTSMNTVSATIINTKTITDTVELQTSADQVYETLLDPGRVAAWTRARPDVFKNVGSHFSLFDGNITGTMLELVPNKKIVQTWRLKTWPEEHHSKVTMTLEQTSEATKVHIKHEGVPIGEEDVIRGNWQTFYWIPIKSVFGYGALI
jgi:activator of HSP90 ATPase